MPSLTRIEATERAALLDVEHYRIHLDLPAEAPVFRSETTIRFRSGTPGAATLLDVSAARVLEATLNGRVLDVDAVDDGRLALTDLAETNELRLLAEMAYSSDGEGLHRHVDPADGKVYLYAMSFLDAGPRWFACFDQPDLKARYDISVSCPEDWTVLGNGHATQTAPGQWELATTRPLSTYFVTLVAGPYHSVTAEHDGILLGVHARASLAEHLEREAPEMLEVTRRAFDRYHELFGIRYPFGDYHQAFVPDFNAGAMENPGCVTFRDKFVFRSASTSGERAVRANTIAHEMAHMWFGDLVTMRWWDDLWLNESFAEYMSYRVCSEVTDYDAWAEFGMIRKDWGYVADQAPSTHPVAGNGSADAASALDDFDGISYAKGAAVLRQLAEFLGDTVFFAGLRAHFAEHAYGNAEFADLLDAWTSAGAEGLAEWATAWLRTSGLDTLTGVGEDDRAVLRRQGTHLDRPHAVTAGGFDADGLRLWDKPAFLAAGQQVLDVGPLDGAAFVLPDVTDASWAKVRFGDGFAPLARALPGMDDAASRVVCYNAVRDAVRDAELDPAEALGLIERAVRSEPIDFVLAALFGFATNTLTGKFSPAGARPERYRLISDAALDLLERSAAGSDLQLVAARSYAAATQEPGTLQAWLAGADVPAGLRIDDELRWAIVEQLASLGALDEAGIVAELDRDRSTSGVVHAARARALRPDAAAKQAAWRLLVEPSEMPAYELYATAEGFFVPWQVDVTLPYVERYFEQMPATERHRRGWALGRIALLSYPSSHAGEALGHRTEQALAGALPPAIRRSLVDAGDLAGRAARSLARFGAGA